MMMTSIQPCIKLGNKLGEQDLYLHQDFFLSTDKCITQYNFNLFPQYLAKQPFSFYIILVLSTIVCYFSYLCGLKDTELITLYKS